MVHVVLEGVVCADDAISRWRPASAHTVLVSMLDPLHRQQNKELRHQQQMLLAMCRFS